MKISKRQLKQIIRESYGDNHYDQEAKDIRDEHRGYRGEEEEHEVYDPEYGWVTPEELAELESQMRESTRQKENTVKISKRQLKQIIREEYSRLKRRGLIREA